MTGPQRLRFLGIDRELRVGSDWNRHDWSKLWLYNAHYFDDLNSSGASARVEWHRDLIQRWVAENPPGQGNGWEPYPSSLRIVNWIKWALAGNTLEASAEHSLAAQTRFLRQRLEIHLLGNHLWANAKALVFAGAFFEGDEAKSWLQKGMALLEREVGEQFLSDGGHFERSPMYHSILLEDVLDLLQLDHVYPGVILESLLTQLKFGVTRMLRWLRVMSHPDGDIAFFNDAALGIAPPLSALDAYAVAIGIPNDGVPLSALELLPDSGYVRMTTNEAVLIADVGPVGPDYLPGHAHADTLSFELSLFGRRVLVNGGTSTYEAGPLRLMQRGTAMHNTVEVDGQNSSEVWSSFRVARRARPTNIRFADDDNVLVLEAAHDGFCRLPGKVLHSRRWELSEDGLNVVDVLSGQLDKAVARFRFAPASSEADNGLTWQCQRGTANVVPGSWFPRFGEQYPCQVLECKTTGGELITKFTWKQ